MKNRNMARAIEALLVSPTVGEAGKVCGLATRTIYNYLRDPDFKVELSRRQGEVVKATTAMLVGMSHEANRVLLDLLKDEEVPASVRARIALGIKQHVAQALELQDILERVEALENESRNKASNW